MNPKRKTSATIITTSNKSITIKFNQQQIYYKSIKSNEVNPTKVENKFISYLKNKAGSKITNNQLRTL